MCLWYCASKKRESEVSERSAPGGGPGGEVWCGEGSARGLFEGDGRRAVRGSAVSPWTALSLAGDRRRSADGGVIRTLFVCVFGTRNDDCESAQPLAATGGGSLNICNALCDIMDLWIVGCVVLGRWGEVSGDDCDDVMALLKENILSVCVTSSGTVESFFFFFVFFSLWWAASSARRSLASNLGLNFYGNKINN